MRSMIIVLVLSFFISTLHAAPFRGLQLATECLVVGEQCESNACSTLCCSTCATYAFPVWECAKCSNDPTPAPAAAKPAASTEETSNASSEANKSNLESKSTKTSAKTQGLLVMIIVLCCLGTVGGIFAVYMYHKKQTALDDERYTIDEVENLPPGVLQAKLQQRKSTRSSMTAEFKKMTSSEVLREHDPTMSSRDSSMVYIESLDDRDESNQQNILNHLNDIAENIDGRSETSDTESIDDRSKILNVRNSPGLNKQNQFSPVFNLQARPSTSTRNTTVPTKSAKVLPPARFSYQSNFNSESSSERDTVGTVNLSELGDDMDSILDLDEYDL